MIDLSRATATEAVYALRQGDISSVELLSEQLERVKRFNDQVNAVVALDEERAFAMARAADEARSQGQPVGRLHGLPITIKDLYATEGLVTTSGHVPLKDLVPQEDAPAVAAYKSAGAIVFGKTNAPHFGDDFQTYNDIYGLTRNPWNLDRTCGGSSGGSAVSLATGISLLELGGDIGGSIRVPCHYNGVFGHKPSFGAVDRFGEIPIAPTSDGWLHGWTDLVVAGPMGRSVADVRLGLEILTSKTLGEIPGARLPDASPRAASPSGLRIAVIVDDPAAPTSQETKEAVRSAARKLQELGAVVDEPDIPGPPLSEQNALYLRLLADVFAAVPAETRPHGEWKADDSRRRRLFLDYARFFESWDVIFAPIAPTAAFPHQTDVPFGERKLIVDNTEIPYGRHIAWAGFATLPYLPATAVPIAKSSEGLPMGMQIIGPRWGDLTTLSVASLVETLVGGFEPPPGY